MPITLEPLNESNTMAIMPAPYNYLPEGGGIFVAGGEAAGAEAGGDVCENP